MDWADAFSAQLLSRGFAARTVSAYLGHLRRFMAWYEKARGGFDPASVSALDVAEWKRSMQDRGLSPAYVNSALDGLSAFFGWALVSGLVSSDPTVSVKRVPEQKPAPRWVGQKALASFMRVLQKEGSLRDRALVALFLHAGLRVSEACSVKVQDVELKERSGLVRVKAGKGGKWREVPLNATARRELAAYLASHPGGDWLFPGKRGHLTTRAAEKTLASYVRRAGLEGVTPHMLRHTFCKYLVDAGESLDRVAALAGHSSLNTTARYTRPSLPDLEKAVERLAWE